MNLIIKITRAIVGHIIPRPILVRIKYAIQYIYRLFHHVNLIESEYKIFSIAQKNAHVFFGYYDVSPFNRESDEIIFLRLRDGNDKIDIVLSHLNNLNDIKLLCYSYAWNWQQGVRLRWMSNNNREICFNDFKKGKYLARIVNIDTLQERSICKPLYDISPDGHWGLSLDFERLGIMRPGYGYNCQNYTTKGRDLSKEGIDLIDLQNNSSQRIITYKMISDIVYNEKQPTFDKNYINHISYSPSGNRFLFFWLTKNETNLKADLLIYDFETKNISLLEDKNRVSHYAWINDNRILCTAFDCSYNCHYYVYDIQNKTKTIVNPQTLREDGHPSIFNNHTIISDTYPDRMGYQKIFLANYNNSVYKQLISIYSNCIIEGEKRTDLHPRLNNKKDIICFDSNQGVFRNLNFIFLTK